MTTDDTRRRANKIVMDLCYRIERMCRYSPLDDKEVCDQSMTDRKTIEGLYVFYRKDGKDEKIAARQARTSAVRLLLNEVFS